MGFKAELHYEFKHLFVAVHGTYLVYLSSFKPQAE